MDPQPSSCVRHRRVWFSPFLLAVALSPIFLQASELSCRSGITTLSELEVIVDGQNIVDGFDPNVRSYSATVPPGTNEAMVHAMSTDPNAQVWIDVVVDGERERYLHGGLGGGDMIVSLPPGASSIEVWIRAPKGATGIYAVDVETATAFPCTEQGILDAIAMGGGPHTFDCNGPTTVVTQAEIVIDNDVILDGEGNLTIDGNDDHRVLLVVPGATAELIALTVTGGALVLDGEQGAGILNEGILTITNSGVVSNRAPRYVSVQGGGIYNSGVLTLESSTVQGNNAEYGCGLYNSGTATLIKSNVSQNGGPTTVSFVRSGSGIANTGTLTLIDSVVSLNRDGFGDAAALSTYGTATLINSLVSDNYSTQSAGVSCGGSTTLINSTVSGNTGLMTSGFECRGTLRLINSTVVALGGRSYAIRFRSEPGELIAVNSIIVGGFDSQLQRVFGCSFENIGAIATSQGGNIESVGDTCAFTDPTDLVNVSAEDLKLGPLADNGGPTMTHALLPGSVAIDQIPAVDCVDAEEAPLTTDQRGEPRPGGTMCDVGAFEVQP